MFIVNHVEVLHVIMGGVVGSGSVITVVWVVVGLVTVVVAFFVAFNSFLVLLVELVTFVVLLATYGGNALSFVYNETLETSWDVFRPYNPNPIPIPKAIAKIATAIMRF